MAQTIEFIVYDIETNADFIDPPFAAGDITIVVPGSASTNTINLPTPVVVGQPLQQLTLTDAEDVSGAVVTIVDQSPIAWTAGANPTIEIVELGTGGSGGPVLPISGAYTTRALLYARFGRLNVLKWAELDNDGTETTEATERIDYQCGVVSYEIDDTLRTIYDNLPFDPVPVTITNIATEMAGYYLYNARGIEDEDKTMVEVFEGARRRLMSFRRLQSQTDRRRVKAVPVTEF